MSTDLQIGDVIAQVNSVRTALGYDPIYELPTATRGDASACLFFRAMSDCGVTGVFGDRVQFSSERQAQLAAELWGTMADGKNVAPPTAMRRTISEFDNGKFDHYTRERGDHRL